MRGEGGSEGSRLCTLPTWSTICPNSLRKPALLRARGREGKGKEKGGRKKWRAIRGGRALAKGGPGWPERAAARREKSVDGGRGKQEGRKRRRATTRTPSWSWWQKRKPRHLRGTLGSQSSHIHHRQTDTDETEPHVPSHRRSVQSHPAPLRAICVASRCGAVRCVTKRF